MRDRRTLSGHDARCFVGLTGARRRPAPKARAYYAREKRAAPPLRRPPSSRTRFSSVSRGACRCSETAPSLRPLASLAWFSADTGECKSLASGHAPALRAQSRALRGEQHAFRALELGCAQRIVLAERLPQSSARQCAWSSHRTNCVSARRSCARRIDRFAPDIEIAFDDLLEIVDAVQEDVVERSRFRFASRGTPMVDDETSARAAARESHARAGPCR